MDLEQGGMEVHYVLKSDGDSKKLSGLLDKAQKLVSSALLKGKAKSAAHSTSEDSFHKEKSETDDSDVQNTKKGKIYI